MHKRKYNLNVNIFNTIDTEQKAYWLGFLLGDSSVRPNYSLRLELANIDLNHIEKCKNFFSSTAPIKLSSKNCNYICFNSKELTHNIQQYGLVINKTYKNILTPNIPNNLLVHFYRGILDADGWITEHKSKNQKSQYEFGFSSYNENFLKEIQLWIEQQLKIKCGYIKERKRDKQRVVQLIIGGNIKFKQLYNLFYKDSTTYLDRKYQKATEFYNFLLNYKDKRGKHPRKKKQLF